MPTKKTKKILASAKNASSKTLHFLMCKYWGKNMIAYYYENEWQIKHKLK